MDFSDFTIHDSTRLSMLSLLYSTADWSPSTTLPEDSDRYPARGDSSLADLVSCADENLLFFQSRNPRLRESKIVGQNLAIVFTQKGRLQFERLRER